MRCAAIQMEATLADVDANLAQAERLAERAATDGARWIVLPEFFTTGIGFDPALAAAALPPDGAATTLLQSIAVRHGAFVGGSFLCRDDDGHVRNAFLLATPDGTIAGRHDKDLPTMWENAFYVGGADDGVLHADGLSVGVAVCWEYMRTQTARRLRERVDVVVGGSGWWSLPAWLPRHGEVRNERLATRAPSAFAPLVGAPVVHAAHAGRLRCAMPWSPIAYDGHFEGGASITAADGRVLAFRSWREGAGVVAADVEPRRVTPRAQLPERFWLHRRGALGAFVWNYQRAHGRRWYQRNVYAPPAMAGRMTSTSLSPTSVSRP